jgi:hypothetical protein
VIFHSYVSLPEGTHHHKTGEWSASTSENHWARTAFQDKLLISFHLFSTFGQDTTEIRGFHLAGLSSRMGFQNLSNDSCVLGMNPPLVGSIVFDGRRMDILVFKNKPLECEYPFAIYGHDLASRKQYTWAATSLLRMSNIKAIRWGHDVPPATVQFFEVDQHPIFEI